MIRLVKKDFENTHLDSASKQPHTHHQDKL